MGDYNELLNEEDKRGHVPIPAWMLRGFKDVVLDVGLCDLPVNRHQYTWNRDTRLSNLIAATSDHSPIELVIVQVLPHGHRRVFKFENGWLHEPELKTVVLNSWGINEASPLLDKLIRCATALELWGKDLALKFKKQILECKHQMQ
ncbi:conserved hypothetical protein [Ricinus communis]|uniref:Endonuclease/exonuclease/phosphatase domain-containing protein n=1 Tax=Ricinus communis TaxID=3988 RepID=B9S3K9_RICCO|nr:conserved hypothetical protein [Ricinus communis]|eukprot:XP_002520578.1 uncharacterized protein LOC8270519 [Ricinus communis]